MIVVCRCDFDPEYYQIKNESVVHDEMHFETTSPNVNTTYRLWSFVWNVKIIINALINRFPLRVQYNLMYGWFRYRRDNLFISEATDAMNDVGDFERIENVYFNT